MTDTIPDWEEYNRSLTREPDYICAMVALVSGVPDEGFDPQAWKQHTLHIVLQYPRYKIALLYASALIEAGEMRLLRMNARLSKETDSGSETMIHFLQ